MAQQILELRKDIEENPESYLLVDNLKSASKGWSKFQIISDGKGTTIKASEEGKETHIFVRCKECGVIYSYNKSNGTSNMVRHQCFITKTGKPTKNQKDRVTKAATMMCIEDIRPYQLVDGPGLRKFAQTLIDIQHETSTKLIASDLIPCGNTVGRHVHEIAENTKVKVKNEILNVEQDEVGVSFCTDAWTDDTNKVCVKLFNFIF